MFRRGGVGAVGDCGVGWVRVTRGFYWGVIGKILVFGLLYTYWPLRVNSSKYSCKMFYSVICGFEESAEAVCQCVFKT